MYHGLAPRGPASIWRETRDPDRTRAGGDRAMSLGYGVDERKVEAVHQWRKSQLGELVQWG